MNNVIESRFVFPASPPPFVEIHGSERLFPVSRIFCVGRNYAEHAKEMGVEIDRQSPFYFMKPASAVVHSGASIPYPPGTQKYHYEMELVVAIAAPAFRIKANDTADVIFGYACGLDMTRRDLQLAAREKGRPWDLGKAFEQSAVLGSISLAAELEPLGAQRISLEVNGTVRQDARLSALLWTVPEIVSDLSQYYHLRAGDLIFTGTPAGVGPVVEGDQLLGKIDSLDSVSLTICAPE